MELEPPGLLEIPAVWYGQELLGRDDWQIELTNDEIAELTAIAAGCRGRELTDLSREALQLPRLGARLAEVQRSLEEGSGAAVIRGFPITDLPDQEAAAAFWAVALHLGTPLSQSATGERIFHVRDEGYRLDDPRARGPNTRKRLSFHTDRCDVIGFMCLREAKSGGDNDLVSSAAVYNEILRRRPDLLRELMQPFFYQRHDVDQGNKQPYCRQPVFSFCDGRFAGSFLRVLIDRAYAAPDTPELTERQREALDYLESVAEDDALRLRFRQRPGEMLFLNNWVTFHRRTEFEDHQQPSLKRHILRIWLSVPNSRPIDPLFQDNYGATAAGAIRGGMRPQR